MNPRKTKATLRRELTGRLRSLPDPERHRQSARIVHHLETNPRWRDAGLVLFYAPLPTEVDIWPLLERRLRAKKRVALPRHVADHDTYEFVEVRDACGDCQAGRFGVREPRESLPAACLRELDLILVPGLGFDYSGGRLGRGKGHYDRLLSEAAAFRCGLAFAEQIIDLAPMEPHDVRMNCIVTPDGWFDAPNRPPAME